MFVNQAAAVETADHVQVNRHTVDRYFRLLRGAIYQVRCQEPLALTEPRRDRRGGRGLSHGGTQRTSGRSGVAASPPAARLEAARAGHLGE